MKDNKNKIDYSLFSPREDFKIYRSWNNQNETNLLGNESALRQEISNDPVKGYELIFKTYYQPLCSHAARFVYSKEVAEDIVCEVFLNFWNKKLYENVSGTFRVYLYTAVRNGAFNYLKKEFKDNFNEETIRKIDFVNGIDESSPEVIVQFNELYIKIQKVIDQFPPQCRKVFILSRFEGKKNREIAEELKLKIKTVEYHIARALFLLKKALAEYLN